MKRLALPLLDYLRSLLEYDPETGDLRWLVTRGHGGRGAVKGQIAGSRRPSGHLYIEIDAVAYGASRIAWVLMQPPDEIDHIDLDAGNNRWNNLRDAAGKNQCNRPVLRSNKLGMKGVHQVGRRFKAQLSVAKRVIYLGTFDNPAEAMSHYGDAAVLYHGEFARWK